MHFSKLRKIINIPFIETQIYRAEMKNARVLRVALPKKGEHAQGSSLSCAFQTNATANLYYTLYI